MSATRDPNRPPTPTHVPPAPPPKLAPADDPAWTSTLMLADLAREARPTKETATMITIDQSAYMFGEPIPYDEDAAVAALAWLQANAPTHSQRSDEWTRWSVGARYLASAVAELAALKRTTGVDDTRTLEFAGVTVTIGTSTGRDGAALVIIDTEGEPDGSDGWKGLRVDVNDGRVFEGVKYRAEPIAFEIDECAARGCKSCEQEVRERDRRRAEAPTFPNDGSMETAP